MVTDATKHYLTDAHSTRKLSAIKCIVLSSYEPGSQNDDEEAMPYSFLVGAKGNIIQTLPLIRYARAPTTVMVGIYGMTEPSSIQFAGVTSLCSILHQRAPRIFKTGSFMWSKEAFKRLNGAVAEMVQCNEPRPFSAFGVRIM